MPLGAGRAIEPEWLDDSPPELARPSLADLVRINRMLGGYSTVRALFAGLVEPGQSFSVLDAGAASGDMGAAIRKRYPHAAVTSLDRKANHLAQAAYPKVLADAFQLPFSPKSFDFVFSSLFLHHFEDAAVVELLRGFGGVARRAVLAVDLERGPLGYHFVPATRWLFGWDPITVHDAPISVAAAFKADELRALALRAGLRDVRVMSHRPWARLSLAGMAPD